MNAQQPNLAAPPVPGKPHCLEKGPREGEEAPSLQVSATKVAPSVGCGWKGPLITEQSSCSHKRGHWNHQASPWLQDQAIASRPLPSTKANARFPLQLDCKVPTWSPTSYTSCKEKGLLQTLLTLFFWLPMLRPFLLCFLHSCLYTQMHTLYSWNPPDCHSYKQYCILRKLRTWRIFIPSAIYQYCWVPDALLYAI